MTVVMRIDYNNVLSKVTICSVSPAHRKFNTLLRNAQDLRNVQCVDIESFKQQ